MESLQSRFETVVSYSQLIQKLVDLNRLHLRVQKTFLHCYIDEIRNKGYENEMRFQYPPVNDLFDG